MTYYIDQHGQRHSTIPKIWNGITPFNQIRAAQLGWQKIQQPDVDPSPVDTTQRDVAQRAIVQLIVHLALEYDAIEDLIQIEDITIPNLQALATAKGVPLARFGQLITEITPIKWQLEAVVGRTWAMCWQGLKSRFPEYISQILSGLQDRIDQQPELQE